MDLEIWILSVLRIALLAFPIFALPEAIFKLKEALQENDKKKMSKAVTILVCSVVCVGSFIKTLKGFS